MKTICTDCGRLTHCQQHHEPPRSRGGTTLIPLCFYCHVLRHRVKGDWADWGRKGGQRTAANPQNWKRNLKQYRKAALT